MTSPPELARELFGSIATTYERWARLLSLGQDARWRREMVDGPGLSPGSAVLDVAFGYLLRYVHDVPRCLEELVRIVRPGGVVGMVEFGVPTGGWRMPRWLYTRTLLPAAGAVIGSGWWQVGRFLGPSIDAFAGRYPPDRLAAEWGAAGMENVRFRRMSLGGGLVMWGRRR